MSGTMAKKNEAPAVTTYADHEVIMPPHKLKKAVSKAAPGAAADDPVARAEAALAELSGEFSTWMDTECQRLDQARRKVKRSGLFGAAKEELFRAAHDIKGEAATFGFPRAGEVADSLCRLIEHSPDLERLPIALVDQHVDAVRAIIREAKQENADETAARLAGELRQIADEFLARENRHRPDYLDGILAPPLVPGEVS
jgi:HPt (histidine-containing phosphotransfer) domain-containing protein